MRFLFSFLISFCAIVAFSQTNVSLLSHVNYQQLHNADLNDVWGYANGNGNEYAIVGTTKGTSIVDVSNPSSPVEVFWEPGTQSIWRDPCVHGNYAYVTTEAEDGLLIVDLSPLPGSATLPTNVYTGPIGSSWQSAHTCFVDENGYAYIFGANRGNGGVIILDVHTDPMNPIEVGIFDNWYVHDGFVRNDTMYLAHILDGFFSLVDVSDKANPILLGTGATPDDFTHNIWPSEVGDVVFTTDEVSGAYIASYDISDPSNVLELDRTQHSPGQGVIPHNTHVMGDFLITSYYSDGITIHDITYPNNIILVGEYDTYPGQTTNYDGCWGVYPFLPSGIILASDITEGLFILDPTYAKACYLQGVATDAVTMNPLSGVSVTIAGNDQIDLSGTNGAYASGIYTPGMYSVVYSKVGYFPQTFSVNLSQGVITLQDVSLVPIPPYNLTINVLEEGSLAPISDAQILLSADLIDHSGISNGIGQEDLVLYYEEVYMVSVAKWGYETSCFEQIIDQTTGVLTVYLRKGYQDEFTFDLGWVVSGSASSGMWERGMPHGTDSGSSPGQDADFDCGKNAFVTGNDSSLDPDVDDVDGGYTTLVSPMMDLTTYSDPHLNYSRWFYCMHGAPPNDTLRVRISNGSTLVVVDQVGGQVFDPSWTDRSIRISDYIPLTSTMQVFFRVSDDDPEVNITEAGIDRFSITNYNNLGLSETSKTISVSPNPFESEITLNFVEVGASFEIYSLSGILITEGVVTSDHQVVDLSYLPQGMFLVKLGTEVFKVIKE